MILTPDKLMEYQIEIFPPQASKVINNLIATRCRNDSAKIYKHELDLSLRARSLAGKDLDFVYNSFIDIYTAAGWEISVHEETATRPARPAFYVFTKRIK